MKRFSTFLVLISFFWQTVAYAALPAKFDGIRSSADVEVTGSISAGTGGSPDSKAVLDLKSTTKGMLPPRMTTAQRTAIASPPQGLLVYDTDTATVWQYNGAGWIEVGSGGTAGAQYNVIENFGFEATTYNEDWTASGGVVAEATGTNIIFGEKSATWDASASTQTFSYASLAIGQGYKSNNCEGALFIQTPSGTATHTLQVWDGTKALASVTVYSTTTPKEFSTGAFPCPSSGNWQLRLVANADEPLIAVDNAYLGLARNVGTVAQAFYKGSISMTGCTDWFRSNTAFGGFTATSGCTYAVTGDVLAPSTFIPGFRLQNVAPGRYLIVARGSFGKSVSTTNADISFRFSDGTNTFAEQIVIGAATASGLSLATGELTGTIGYTTAQGTLTYQLQAKTSNTASGTQAFVSDDGGANATGQITGLQFEVFYFPTQSQQVVTPDAQGWFAAGYISGANPDLGTSSVSTYTEITDSSLTLTPDTGSAPIGIVCSSTNAAATPSTGATTCSAGSEGVGFATSVPRAGRYEVCMQFGHATASTATDAGMATAFEIVNTATNSQTILNRMGPRSTSGHYNNPSTSVSKFSNVTACGQATLSAGANAFRLFYEQSSLGANAVSANRIHADADASIGDRAIRVTMRPITTENQAILANSVSTQVTNGLKIESAKLTTTTGPNACAITSQFGTWLTGTPSSSGAGQCSFTIATGIFSSAPNCKFNVFSGGSAISATGNASSATAASFQIWDALGAGATGGVVVECLGPR